MARFKRSDFCALVSVTALVIFAAKKKNPPPDDFWRWVKVPIIMKVLSQQFTCARAHACTTTTCTHAFLAKIAETRHAGSMLGGGSKIRQITFDQ
jgi:hypothetical protein